MKLLISKFNFFAIYFLCFVGLAAAKDYRSFITNLGEPESAYAWLYIDNSIPGALKSDIFYQQSETFALSKKAIDLFLQQVKIYPIFDFEGYPAEAYDAGQLWEAREAPDVKGLITFKYKGGGELLFSFGYMDSVSFKYEPGKQPNIKLKDEACSVNDALWTNSEFFALILYPFNSRTPSRWNWWVSPTIQSNEGLKPSIEDLDMRILQLEQALQEAKDERNSLSEKKK